MSRVSVKSVLDEIPFYGFKVPIGFVIAQAKPNHNPCLGRGEIGFLVPGNDKARSFEVCRCAINGTRRLLAGSGPEKFQEMARAWRASAQMAPL